MRSSASRHGRDREPPISRHDDRSGRYLPVRTPKLVVSIIFRVLNSPEMFKEQIVIGSCIAFRDEIVKSDRVSSTPGSRCWYGHGGMGILYSRQESDKAKGDKHSQDLSGLE
jgi:hypothetical protein